MPSRLFLSLSLDFLLAGLLAGQSPVLLKDINLFPKPNGPSTPKGRDHDYHRPWDNFRFARIGNFLFFSADDGKSGRELYKSLPSTNSALLVKDINPKGGSNPSKFIVMNNVLYFSAYDGKSGIEVWRSDGTQAGTYLLKDCNPGTASGDFYFPVVMGKKLFWTARGGTGYRLWCTDGTTAGTKVVVSGLDRFWYYPVPFGNKIFFRGGTQANGYEPWVTDGTKTGTKMLIDVQPGTGSGYVYYPVEMGGKVYWTSYNGSSYNIYVSDGTPTGTKVVYSGLRYSWYYPTPLGNKIIFRGNTSANGYEPWVTDGTAAGTAMVKDIYSGSASGYPYYMTAAGSRHVVFTANDGTHGTELWKSDGTAAGTMMTMDIRPGSSSSSPYYMVLSGGQILFRADDGVHGYEPWAYFPGGNAKGFGFGTSDLYPFSATDPALGASMKMTVSGMATGQGGLILLAGPTTTPTAFGQGWLYFNPLFIYMGLVVTPAGGGSTTLAVPNDPALVGAQIASQGLVYPTSTPPIGVDFTNAVLLTFGN